MSISPQHSPPRRTGPKVFISYRRTDSYPALRLKDELTDAFGDGAVFIDDEDIRPGDRFTDAIREAIESCDVFLVLISPDWLSQLARLREPADLVRREIADALARQVTLIPLLIDGAPMPKPDELPEEVKSLSDFQAFPLSKRWWKNDVQRLIDDIRARDAAPPPEPAPPDAPDGRPGPRRHFGPWWVKAVMAAVLLAAGLAVWRAFSGAPAVTGTGGNTNFATPTRSPTDTPPAHTPPPAATPAWGAASPEQCLKMSVPSGRSTSIEYGDAGVRVVGSDQHLEGSAGVLFTENGQPVGALKFRFIRSGDNGVFKVEQVLGPDCRPAEDYGNDDHPGVRETLNNYDHLRMRLGQKYYYLRVVYRPPNTLAVQFMDRPDKPR